MQQPSKDQHELEQKPFAPLRRHETLFSPKSFIIKYEKYLLQLHPWEESEMAKINACFGGPPEILEKSVEDNRVLTVYFYQDAVLELKWKRGGGAVWNNMESIRWFSFDGESGKFKIYHLEFDFDEFASAHLFVEKDWETKERFIYNKTWSKLHPGQ